MSSCQKSNPKSFIAFNSLWINKNNIGLFDGPITGFWEDGGARRSSAPELVS